MHSAALLLQHCFAREPRASFLLPLPECVHGTVGPTGGGEIRDDGCVDKRLVNWNLQRKYLRSILFN